MIRETPWVQKYLDDGWEWRRKAQNAPHLCRGGRTLCGRSADDLDRGLEGMHGCFSCRDIAGGIIFDRNHGVAS